MEKIWWIATLLYLAPLAVLGKEAPDSLTPGEPRLVTLPPQRVLAVTVKGAPNEAAGKAYKKLYRTFYAYADKAEKRHAGSPMARWATGQLESPKAGWIGIYALPVSESFPDVGKDGVRIETWEYGLTAEILHVGPYGDEAADIAALKGFIARNGFSIRGSHEEVYLKGPGMIIKGKSSKYRTLIRYGVERVGEPIAPIAGKPSNQTIPQASVKE